MIKAAKYRLVPTHKQRVYLVRTLNMCSEVWNLALEQRKYQRIGRFEQARQLTQLKAAFPEFRTVHNQPLEDVMDRLDKAFQAFFRRVKAGQKPGYPRFRNRHRYDSFTMRRDGFRLEGKMLKVGKVGNIKVRLSRPLPDGAIAKNCVLRRKNGKWSAIIAFEAPSQPLPATTDATGIDVGIASFAALSDGTFISNPRIYESAQKALRKAQRKVARRKRGSVRRRKAVALLRLLHDKIVNRRRDFLHKESTKLIQRYGLIVAEKLNIAGLSRGKLAKQINDVGWAEFFQMLSYKAGWAGREFIQVDARGTSQTCPQCGAIQKKTLSQRQHVCPCGLSLDRDTAAAQVILARKWPSGRNAGEVTPCVV